MAAAGAKRKNTAGAKAEAQAEAEAQAQAQAQADGAQQAKRRQVEPIARASEEMEDSLSASEDSDTDNSGSDIEMGDGETKLGGENTGDGDSDNAAAGKQHRGGKAATNSEIMALNEAALLFKSNLFKLQADELLGEALVVAGTKETRGLDAALRQIREVLVALEEVPAVDVDAASNLARKLGVSIPFPDPAPPAGMALQLAFSAPAAVTVVGSYALGMAVRTRSGITVDVAAQMPAALFQDRDHLNCRYFYKRAFYVAMLVAGLRRSALNDAFDIGVEAVRDDARLPAVVLRPRTRRVGGSVRLLPCIAGDTLALARLGGARNSLRPSFIAAGAADEDAPPTPQYNAALAGDALMVAHMRFLHETAGMCPAFARGAALLRVWLRQRVALGAQARVTGFALSLVLAWLVRQGRVGSGLGAHALFKACVEFLAARDFEAQPVAFGAALAGFGGAVLADPTATTNVLAGVGDGELAELRLAARAAALDANAADDRFARIFLAAPAPAAQRFDHVLRLDVALAPFLAPRGGAAARRLAELDHGSPVAAVRARIEALLGAALDAQARAVVVRAAPCALGDLVRAQRRHVFVVGLVARGDAAQRVVGLGPSPAGDAAAAARFRALWGARAELRRFRDGAIRLATVWGGADAAPEQRALVLPRMAAFLVRRHFAAHAGAADVLTREDREAADRDPPRAALPFAGTQPRALSLAPRLDGFAQTQGAGGAAFEPALAALDELRRELAALEHQLPLRVLALHAAAPALRYASLAPPKPLRGGASDAFVAPLAVAVEFVGSTRWPDDLVALHKVKAAFLLRLGACYAAAHPGAAVAAGDRLLGRGARDGVVPRADDCFVDIGHAASGLTFRLWVLCGREGALLERRARDLRLVPALHAQASAYEDAHRRWLLACVWRPRHHRLVLGLCQRHHPAASLTMRLLKRWLASHMLLATPGAVPEEVAELLVAHVFSASEAAPASACAGLARCLRVLAEWRWRDDLCVADFSAPEHEGDDEGVARASSDPAVTGVWANVHGMGAGARKPLQLAFDAAAARGALKGGLRVATEDDPEAQWWPPVSAVATRRLAVLARASLACIDLCVEDGCDGRLSEMFTAPMADYDFIIKLDLDAVSRRYEQPPKAAFAAGASQPEDAEEPVAAGKRPAEKEVFKNLLPATAAAGRQIGGAHSFKTRANPFGQPGMVGFDPIALFVHDLHAVYGDSLMLFNDVYGGSVIAGLWNPAVVAKPAAFACNLNANMAPVPKEEMGPSAGSKKPLVRFNMPAVIEEIIRLGDGLVEDVVIQRDPVV